MRTDEIGRGEGGGREVAGWPMQYDRTLERPKRGEILKAKQHYVPQVLLRRFADPSPPKGWPRDRPYEPAVWVVDRDLDEDSRRREPKNILFRKHLYTLDDDSPSAPAVEEALGRIETAFGEAMGRLESGAMLEPSHVHALIAFAACLRVRHPSWMDHHQDFVDRVQQMFRQVDRSLNDAESYSDHYWQGADEAGRRGAIELVGGLARVLASTCGFVVNRSKLPFVTSDRAVVHIYLDWEDLRAAGFPPALLTHDPSTGEALFFWAPLDPQMGLVSSPHLLGAAGVVTYAEDEILPFVLNEFVRRTADEFVVGSIEDPYGAMKEALKKSESRSREFLSRRTGLELVVGLKRIWIETNDLTQEPGDHPLITRYRFRTNDLECLKGIEELGKIAEIHEYRDGSNVGFTRGGRLLVVAKDADAESIIESGPEDWE